MAYTLDQWKQVLPDITSLDQLPGYSDQLSNYSWVDSSKLGTDAFSNFLTQNSYDFGDRRAVDNSTLNYLKDLSTSAQNAGLGVYGVGAIGPQLTNLYNFEGAKYDIPIARFGDTETGGQNWRYVPYELATRAQVDTETGNLQHIAELFAPEFYQNASLVRLPDQYKSQFANADWMGTNYNFTDPTLGYMVSPSYLGELYARIGTSTDGGIRPTGTVGVDNPQPFTFEDRSDVYASGDITQLAGQQYMPMTDAARNAILSQYQMFFDQPFYETLNMLPYTDNYGGTSYVRGRLNDASYNQYKDIINNASYYLRDAENPGAFGFVDKVGDSYRISTNPFFLTAAAPGAISDEAQQIANFGGGFGDLVLSAIPSIAGSFLAGPVLGLSGAAAGAVSGGISSAMNDGDILQGVLTGGLGGAAGELTSGITDSFASSDWFKDLSPDLQSTILSGVSGATSGGIGAALTGNDILEGVLAGGAGGAAGQFVRENIPTWLGEKGLDLGLSGSLTSMLSNVSGSAASNLAKDLVETGGDNFADILKGAGYNLAGNLAAGAAYDALKTTPEVKDGAYIVDGVAYKDDPTTGEAKAVGFQSANGDITSFSEYATSVGAENPYDTLDYIDNKNIRKYSQAAGAGVAEYLKSGSIEYGLLSALPYAAQGAVDQLFDALGMDTRFDEGAIANKLISLGVAKEKADILAESAYNARRSAIEQGMQENGVSAEDAAAAANARTPEERNAILKARKAKRNDAKARRGVLASAQQLMQRDDTARGNALRTQAPTEEEQPSGNKDILDPALAEALAELEAMGVQYADV